MSEKLNDKFVGALLGTAIGDILGAGVEGLTAEQIEEKYGEVRDFLHTSRGFGKYTDDTQMTIALGVSIIDCGKVYASDCSYRYAEYYEPERGYGSNTGKIMLELKKGVDHLKTGKMFIPGGSYGDGGAMRIAPVGLTYRNESHDYLKYGVQDALVCTHEHPEAIDGALVQAKAISLLVQLEDPSEFDPKEFLSNLLEIAETQIMKEKISKLIEILDKNVKDRTAVQELGNGVRTSEAVSCALLAASRYHSEPEKAVIKAVNFGGDTDTIGAMTGALMGALHGKDWIPDRWFDNIENGDLGRDFIIQLAEDLVEIDP